MTQRLPCKVCGELIHPDTALKNDGLCMPCKGGYRESIEAGKRHREQERAYRQSAEFKFWQSLVQRVHGSSEGYQSLSAPERTYFAVNALVGEVYNGGFDQFFCNSTGDYYADALAGLRAIGAGASAELLLKAKQAVFGDLPVPAEQADRFRRMRAVDVSAALDELDSSFYEDPDSIADLCHSFALANGLYQDG